MSASDAPYMSQANALGQGFDVYGAYDASSLMGPLVDLTPDPENRFSFLGVTYTLPRSVKGIEQTTSDFNEGSFESRDGFQNKIAAHAGVDVGYGAFSGQMEASYSADTSRSSEEYYAFRNFFSRLGYLDLLPDQAALRPDFQAAVERLPDTVTDQNFEQFSQFFQQFGIYYTRRITLGASLEFYVQVSQETSDSTREIDVMVKAHYTGLFATGSVDASIANSQAWQSYTANSSLRLETTGGDVTRSAKLQAVDTKNPSGGTVSAYEAWLESIAANPAAVEFQLGGIWELCGAKSSAVSAAWYRYGQRMRPQLTMETTSLEWGEESPPVIILAGRAIRPDRAPATTVGYQVAIVERKRLLDPDAVRFNRYYTMDPRNWDAGFRETYTRMTSDIRDSGYADANHVLLVASMGLNYNCSPNLDFYTLLRTTGGGKQLMDWYSGAMPGSNNPDNATYLFAGIFNQDPGAGIEQLQHAWGQNVRSNLTVYFYRRPQDDRYSMGRGPSGFVTETAVQAGVSEPAAPEAA